MTYSVDDIRRTRLAQLVTDFGSVARLAETIGVSPAQLSQWVNASKDSKTGRPRGMRSDSARKIESKCGKPTGWLDSDPRLIALNAALQQYGNDDETLQELFECTRAEALSWRNHGIPEGAAVLRSIQRMQEFYGAQAVGERPAIYAVTTDQAKPEHIARNPFEIEVLAAARLVPPEKRERFLGWFEERLKELHPEANAGPSKAADGGRDATLRKKT